MQTGTKNPTTPSPTKGTQSMYKGAKVGGYVVVGGILAAWICGQWGQVCTAAGGHEVVAGAIAGALYSAWDYTKRKAGDILNKR